MSYDRIEIIKSLLEFSDSLDNIKKRIHNFDWDYEGEAVELTPDHLINTLKKFIEGKINLNEIEEWANLIEGRDDIIFNAVSKDWIEDTIFKLANPDLESALDISKARELLASRN